MDTKTGMVRADRLARPEVRPADPTMDALSLTHERLGADLADSLHDGLETRAAPPRAALAAAAAAAPAAPGAPGGPVQADGELSAGNVHAVAQRGLVGPGSSLPFQSIIQRSFGTHDISGVRAHTGSEAAQATQDLGASAYATGNDVALGPNADLHTVAHEAAHVVQQRSGVRLQDGVGRPGDVYERHADAVADRVVAGRPAQALLDGMAGGVGPAPGGTAVQGFGFLNPFAPRTSSPAPSAPAPFLGGGFGGIFAAIQKAVEERKKAEEKRIADIKSDPTGRRQREECDRLRKAEEAARESATAEIRQRHGAVLQAIRGDFQMTAAQTWQKYQAQMAAFANMPPFFRGGIKVEDRVAQLDAERKKAMSDLVKQWHGNASNGVQTYNGELRALDDKYPWTVKDKRIGLEKEWFSQVRWQEAGVDNLGVGGHRPKDEEKQDDDGGGVSGSVTGAETKVTSSVGETTATAGYAKGEVKDGKASGKVTGAGVTHKSDLGETTVEAGKVEGSVSATRASATATALHGEHEIRHGDGSYHKAEADAGVVGGEFGADDEGGGVGAGATAGQIVGKQGNIGSGDKDEERRFGVGAGVGAGARGHWGDSDNDGRREYGFGVDFGPFTGDIKTEDPARTFLNSQGLDIAGVLFGDGNVTEMIMKDPASVPMHVVNGIGEAISDPSKALQKVMGDKAGMAKQAISDPAGFITAKGGEAIETLEKVPGGKELVKGAETLVKGADDLAGGMIGEKNWEKLKGFGSDVTGTAAKFGRTVGDGLMTAGGKIAEGAEYVGGGIVKGAKVVGEGIKDTGEKVWKEVKKY